MRTTVTLDPDVERLLRAEAHRSRESFRKVLARSVGRALQPASKSRPSILPPRSLGLRPGIDPRRLSKLAGDHEAEAFRDLGARRSLAAH